MNRVEQAPPRRQAELIVLWSLWRREEGHDVPQTLEDFVQDLNRFLSAPVCRRSAAQTWEHVLGRRSSSPHPATISVSKLRLLAAKYNVANWYLDDLWEILEYATEFQADPEDDQDAQADERREPGAPLTRSGLDALSAEVFSEIERRERGNLRRPLLCGRDLLHLFGADTEGITDGDE